MLYLAKRLRWACSRVCMKSVRPPKFEDALPSAGSAARPQERAVWAHVLEFVGDVLRKLCSHVLLYYTICVLVISVIAAKVWLIAIGEMPINYRPCSVFQRYPFVPLASSTRCIGRENVFELRRSCWDLRDGRPCPQSDQVEHICKRDCIQIWNWFERIMSTTAIVSSMTTNF